MQRINTVVIGAGQAGIAASEHLGNRGIDHVVLERASIAQSWRTARWDSLVANGPAWHDRFPNMEFHGSPEGFPHKDDVVRYFEEYAQKIAAPIRTSVTVHTVQKLENSLDFHVDTDQGAYCARNIIAATGPFQTPVIPPLIPKDAPALQIHSQEYRNPNALPKGAVLVIGSGSSGVQIADELMQSGRKTYLAVGPHDRPPRRYRGRDFVWWLGVLGKWNLDTPDPSTSHVTIAVSGAQEGKTIEFRDLAHHGMTLLGMAQGYDAGCVTFAGDLVENLRSGDAKYLALLDEADAYVNENGVDLPLEPQARVLPPDPECVQNPIRKLDLKAQDIKTIIWATGYKVEYPWLKVDTFGPQGEPVHKRGVSQVPGVYFLGLPWQTRRGSSFIWGVWHDAKFIADQIEINNAYQTYPV